MNTESDRLPCEQDVSSEGLIGGQHDEAAASPTSPRLSLMAVAALLGANADFLMSGIRFKYKRDGTLCQNLECDEKLPAGKPRYCKSCRAKLGDFKE